MAKNDIIKLSDIIPLENLKDYKVHCAVINPQYNVEPLQDFIDGNWDNWNRYKTKRNNFNQKYIFSMMRFYHEGSDIWLFGGIYETGQIKKYEEDGKVHEYYDSKLCAEYSEYIGRLKIKFRNNGRQISRKMEEVYDDMEIVEILRESYVGITFTGYENINLSYPELKSLIKNRTADWHGALKNARGIYLIMDGKTGKGYVGCAKGRDGIWSRWSAYIKGSGDGGNKELEELREAVERRKIKGYTNFEDYMRVHFRFILLEYCPKNMEDNAIGKRESHWKEILLTRDFGYNAN